MGIPHAETTFFLLSPSNHNGVLLHSDVLGDSRATLDSDNVVLESTPLTWTGMATVLIELLFSTFVHFLLHLKHNRIENAKPAPTTKPIQIPITKIKAVLLISCKLRIYSNYFKVCTYTWKYTDKNFRKLVIATRLPCLLHNRRT